MSLGILNQSDTSKLDIANEQQVQSIHDFNIKDAKKSISGILKDNHERYNLVSLNSPPFVLKLQQNFILGSTQQEFQNCFQQYQLPQVPHILNIFLDNIKKVKSSTTSNSKMIMLQIWQIIMFMQSFHILVYIPIQHSFQLLNFNYPHISLIVVNIFISYHSVQHIEQQQVISRKFIPVNDCIKSQLVQDIITIAVISLNNIQINLLLDLIVIILIQAIFTGKLMKLWSRFFQYKLDFYQENILILVFKTIITLNTMICFLNILETINTPDQIEDQFSNRYLASAKVCLSILSFSYQADQKGIEIQLISFFALFLDMYLFHSFQQTLSKQGIEIHAYLKQNNFNFVLREQLLNSIAVQKSERKIHFPQRLADEIKVNQRLPLLVKYFKGYDIQLLKEIAIKAQEIIYNPSESIIQENVPDDCSLYFLLAGSAEIQNSGFILQSIYAPYVFGEMSFYTQQPRQATLVALTQCLILKVSRQMMVAGLGQAEKELFYEKKDQISFNCNLPIECICCKSNKHCIAQCTLFRIEINPVITETLTQIRCEYIRRPKKSTRIVPEQKKSQLSLSPCKQVNSTGEQRISVNCLRDNSDLSVAMEDQIQFNVGECNLSKKFLSSQESNKLIHDQTFNFQLQASELQSYSDTIEENDQGNELQLESEISKIQKNQGELISPQGQTMYSAMVMSSFQETQVNQDFTFMRLPNFDRYQIFSKYFPEGNIDRILQNIH